MQIDFSVCSYRGLAIGVHCTPFKYHVYVHVLEHLT